MKLKQGEDIYMCDESWLFFLQTGPTHHIHVPHHYVYDSTEDTVCVM